MQTETLQKSPQSVGATLINFQLLRGRLAIVCSEFRFKAFKLSGESDRTTDNGTLRLGCLIRTAQVVQMQLE